IVTGGLGPTIDDLTARAAAKATGGNLLLSEEALAHVRKVAGKLGGGIHPLNERQALIPDRSALIPNPIGTACGFELIHNGCAMFFMPGVPVEMAQMLEETVIPRLVELRHEKTCLATKVLKVFGLSEAEVEARLEGLVTPGVTLAFGLDFPEIHVKLRADGEERGLVAEALGQAEEQVRQRIGGYIFGEDADTIDSIVAELFRRKRVTLSLAESCTGGMVAKRITDVPGSSDYFLEGIVTYADVAKTRMLGVSAGLLAEKGAVSTETALAMAEGVRKNSGSDLAVAVTGIAGPGGGSKEKPVGTVFLALVSPAGCQGKQYRFSGNREEIRAIATFTALDWLRNFLLSS
ncbi:MAG: CinA family nicotinamide mononucleotide deamidase-related protein, partial [Geobacter sp.]